MRTLKFQFEVICASEGTADDVLVESMIDLAMQEWGKVDSVVVVG